MNIGKSFGKAIDDEKRRKIRDQYPTRAWGGFWSRKDGGGWRRMADEGRRGEGGREGGWRKEDGGWRREELITY